MIREFGEAIGDTVVESVGRAVGRTQERRPLPVDLLESDDSYLAVFDAPGVDAGDVQVRFEDGVLEVHLERFREFREGYEMRFPGRGLALEGRVALPPAAAVDPSAATATLADDGTLRVRIPKEEGDDTGGLDDSDEMTDSDDADEKTDPDA